MASSEEPEATWVVLAVVMGAVVMVEAWVVEMGAVDLVVELDLAMKLEYI